MIPRSCSIMHVVTGKDPGFHQPVTEQRLMTPDNIDALMQAQADGTAP